MKILLLSLLLACDGGETDADDGTTDGGSSADGGSSTDGGTASDGGGTDGGTTDFNGDLPAKALPAPEFVATNRDGTGRDREDLLGHPTVMWFYPLAGTAG